MRIGIYRRKLVTGLCNKSVIRLCAVDSPERVEGAIKSNSGLRVYRELGQGPRGAREIYSFPLAACPVGKRSFSFGVPAKNFHDGSFLLQWVTSDKIEL